MHNRLQHILLLIIISLSLASCQKRSYFEVSVIQIEAPASGNTVHFFVNSSGTWTASSDEDWCVLSPSSGPCGQTAVTATISQNLTFDDRECTITLISGDFSSKVAVTQTMDPDNPIVIPDKAFKGYLVSHYDVDGDGEISYSEGQLILSIKTAYMKDVSSLEGIRHFHNLEELDCEFCSITELDLSGNPALKELLCSHNPFVTQTIDLSNNPALETFYCIGDGLSSLDFSQNPSLEYIQCTGNRLGRLDLSGNTSLRHLWCDKNCITELDLEGCTSLGFLYCTENMLTALDLTTVINLSVVDCRSNPRLETIYLTAGYCVKVSKGERTRIVYMDDGGKEISIPDGDPAVNFTDAAFGNFLLTLFDYDANGVISITEAGYVKYIDCRSLGVTSMAEINLFPSLRYICCTGNKLRTLDTSCNPDLEYIYCFDNMIESLDVSKNPKLKTLSCYCNQLTSIDVSQNPALETLSLSGNPISELDVSANPLLEILWCTGMKLKTLDISANLSLWALLCSSNPDLIEVWMKEGQTLSILDIDEHTNIRYK